MSSATISNFYIFLLKKKKIILTFLILYSIYNALIIGVSWDLPFHLNQGKVIFNYLFSFGSLNENVHYREFYSASYWTIVYFISQFFPRDYSLQIFHLVNLSIGWMTLFGFYKLGKILFNENIGVLFFIFLFFHPVFFGHMSINGKDTILTFSHIWIFYFFIEYLNKQNNNFESKKIIIKIAILLSLATGIQLYFPATLIPLFFFGMLEIFFLKKFININFNYKKLIKDIFFIFLIFYFIMIIFWVDAHNNILKLPVNLFLDSFNTDRGWKTNMINGNIYFSNTTPLHYILTLTIYKSPEYLLLLYIFFIFFYFSIQKFFAKNFKLFNHNLSLILSIIFFPTFLLMISPFQVYDGLRLFLWYVPYTVMIPALTAYYLLINYKILINKLALLSTFVFFFFYLINFFGYTPFHYTYLNALAGKPSEKNLRFVNDYWGTSLNELIKKIDDHEEIKNKKITVYSCGYNNQILKKYIKNIKSNIILSDRNNSDYIIFNNRTLLFTKKNKKKLQNCYDYLEKKIVTVTRMGHELGAFGLIKKN